MISSGLNVPRPAMPMPDFEVPKAAPTAIIISDSALPPESTLDELRTAKDHLFEIYRHLTINPDTRRNSLLTAEATPAKPKNDAKGGHVDMMDETEDQY